MSLFRATRRYANDRLSVEAGQVVDLDEDTAALLERDSAGVLVPLAAAEAGEIAVALAEASDRAGVELRLDFTPGPGRGRHLDCLEGNAGDLVMSTSNMPGLRRG